MPQHSILVSAEAYRAARQRAAAFVRADRARIVLSGEDRRSYLQGLLTNDIAALTAGSGCYAAYLTAQGRMIADLFVYELGDAILLSVPAAVKDTLVARFDQFIFSEDVRIGDVTDAFAEIAVVGPVAAALVAAVVGESADRLAALGEHGNLRVDVNGSAAIVVGAADLGEPGFGVFVERTRAEATLAALVEAGAAALDAETAEAIRIEGGVPRFGADMDEDTIPLEAGIEGRAISFTKGCYVGQEVIIRVMHRGHGRVARRLVGLLVDGEAPPRPGTAVRREDKEIGQVTSSAWSPALERPIALGYVHRDFVEPGTVVSVGDARATVSALPFVARE